MHKAFKKPPAEEKAFEKIFRALRLWRRALNLFRFQIKYEIELFQGGVRNGKETADDRQRTAGC